MEPVEAKAVAASAHAEWYAETASLVRRTRSAERGPAAVPGRGPRRAGQHRRGAGLVRREHDPLLGGRVAIGFGWTWVVLGDGTAGAARVRGALSDALPAAEHATGLLLAGWLEASAGDVALAQADLDAAGQLVDVSAGSTTGEAADEVLMADVHRHQAFVAIQQGRPDVVLASAATALAVYRPRELTWRSAGCLLLAAFGSLMMGDVGTAARDAGEAVDILTPIHDSWGLVHAQAMLGGIAQAEHRFSDAANALEQAADQSAAMGFIGQAALHRATLGRVQQRAGDPLAASTYRRAIAGRIACGDGRLAATARLNLARLHRVGGDRQSTVALLEENERCTPPRAAATTPSSPGASSAASATTSPGFRRC